MNESCYKFELDVVYTPTIEMVESSPIDVTVESKIAVYDDDILVAHYGCDGYGPPWRAYVSSTKSQAKALLMGDNQIGSKKKLRARFTTVVNKIIFTLVVYGSRTCSNPDGGEVDVKVFANAIGKYRGSASKDMEKYIIRQEVCGTPSSYPLSDEFPPEFRLNY